MSGNDALSALAEIIKVRDASPGGRGLGELLARIGSQHTASHSGNCEICAFGNTEWPCGEWIESLDIAVAWVADYIAAERADE